jgi:hypothetical protein
MFVSIPKALREKIGEEAAESLIELLNTSSQNSQNNVIALAEEKFEHRLSEELAKVRGEISTVKSDLEKRISEVKEESHKNQASTIRWMFVFWVGQIGAMLGILFAFFR